LKDSNWRRDHNGAAFTPDTYARMKTIRSGYALTLGMLKEGFEFLALSREDAVNAAANFPSHGSYGIELAQRIQFLCDNAPEPEEMIEPTTPTDLPLNTRFQVSGL
jgi:hypothetical protein